MRASVRAGSSAGIALAGLALVSAEVHTDFLLLEPLNILVSLLWVIGITNAFNLLDNMDGLSAGVATIASFVLLLNAWLLGEFFIALVLTAFIGSLLGFLLFNWHPASIFLGDCGSLFIGFMLAALTLLERFVTHAPSTYFPVLMPVIVLALPILDTTTVVLIRLREHRPIYVGDSRHLSHRLVSLGMSRPLAVATIYLISLGLGLGRGRPAARDTAAVRDRAAAVVCVRRRVGHPAVLRAPGPAASGSRRELRSGGRGRVVGRCGGAVDPTAVVRKPTRTPGVDLGARADGRGRSRRPSDPASHSRARAGGAERARRGGANRAPPPHARRREHAAERPACAGCSRSRPATSRAAITFVFGDAAVGKATTTEITADVYAQLFASRPPPEPEAGLPADAALASGGLSFGRISVMPALTATWVDADVTFDTPQPTRDRYLQVQPGVTVSAPLFTGQLALNYEPRFRFFSTNEALEYTSHFASARLGLPIGSRLNSRVGYTYTRALLEANVVDAGREYFYNLAPFTYQSLDAGLDFAVAPRLAVLANVAVGRSRFEENTQAGFFDYDHRLLGAGLGYDLKPDLRVDLTYSYDSMPPPPEREFAETTGHGVTATLAGAIGPLMSGSLHAGLRSQTSPGAEGESASWNGLVVGGALRRELGRSTSVEISLNRGTQLSGFETNAYYVTNSATLALTAPLPLQISARGSVSWLRNDYPDPAKDLGVPREDRLLGWTAGLGRDLGSRMWLRLDYRREQRESNVPGLDVTTYGFMVQAGLRFNSGAGTP